jgi:DNA modification methylase
MQLHHGDCLDILPQIPDQSVDAVITDSPYPCIKRDYGYWTVEEWWALIVEGVIPQVRRILKPTGSAVFILQPNSKHVGQMRGWLWEFMAWVCREWNMVQDVWWWNITTLPSGVCSPRGRGLTRQSIKCCVWAGPPSCYRQQSNILLDEAKLTRIVNQAARIRHGPTRTNAASGHGVRYFSVEDAADERSGVTPFNCLPIGTDNARGNKGHGATTPLKLANWWTRYICPPGGTVCDPFMGSGTMGIAAVNNGCDFVGVERDGGYYAIAQQRIEAAQQEMIQGELIMA